MYLVSTRVELLELPDELSRQAIALVTPRRGNLLLFLRQVVRTTRVARGTRVELLGLPDEVRRQAIALERRRKGASLLFWRQEVRTASGAASCDVAQASRNPDTEEVRDVSRSPRPYEMLCRILASDEKRPSDSVL